MAQERLNNLILLLVHQENLVKLDLLAIAEGFGHFV